MDKNFSYTVYAYKSGFIIILVTMGVYTLKKLKPIVEGVKSFNGEVFDYQS